MTKKKRVIVSLSDEAFSTLNYLVGFTVILDGETFTVSSKSKLIEKLLLHISKDLVIK